MDSIDGIISDPPPFSSGVIHGRVVGPLVILMCINNALNKLSHDVPFLFADDSKVVHPLKANVVSLCRFVCFGRRLYLLDDRLLGRK